MHIWIAISAIIAAYFIGSISFAVLVSRAMGVADPRTFGSGNPGATNVLRSGSKKAALLTLLLDALKGYIPVVLALMVFVPEGWSGAGPYVVAAVALAAFLGHLYPCFFKFKGGKGVATAFGVLLGISPWLGLAVVLTWLAVAFATRYASLASVIAALSAPVYWMLLVFFKGQYATPGLLPVGVMIISMTALLVYRHRQNIQNLVEGMESKIGNKSS